MGEEIERNCIELGEEGRLIRMQLDELMEDVPREKAAHRLRLRGEARARPPGILEQLAELPYQRLLDLEELTVAARLRARCESARHEPSRRAATGCSRSSRGFPRRSSATSSATSASLDAIIRASHRDLEAVDGVGSVRAREIREGLRRLQEHNLVDRYLQL